MSPLKLFRQAVLECLSTAPCLISTLDQWQGQPNKPKMNTNTCHRNIDMC